VYSFERGMESIHRLLIFIATIVAGYFIFTNVEHKSSANQARIVNGTPVDIDEGLPRSVVLILVKKPVKNSKKIKTSRCTGNILDEGTIITAAHCFDHPWKRVDIFVGAYSFDDFHLDHSLKNQHFYIEHEFDSKDLDDVTKANSTNRVTKHGVYIHPVWDGDVNKGYDVALIRLPKNEQIKLNNQIQPIKLEAREIPEFARFYMLGFGRLNRDMKKTSMALRKTLLVNRHTDVCLDIMQKFPNDFPTDDVKNFVFVPNSICAVRHNVPTNTAGQPCNGDSGGSIFTLDNSNTFAIAGTLSWGTPQSCTLFTIFEKVAFNKEWIDKFGDYFNV